MQIAGFRHTNVPTVAENSSSMRTVTVLVVGFATMQGLMVQVKCFPLPQLEEIAFLSLTLKASRSGYCG
jgi:uncharacterized membrane protein